MDLRNESDQVLLSKTVKLAREERELLTSILHHLREINRRRLYSALKYQSLHDFAVKHLGYPDDQAYRRINAMKLLCELPEMEERINSGDLSLTHLNIAQRHFKNEEKAKNEPLSRDQKLDVLNKIADKSVREAERITLGLSSAPEELKPDKFRNVSEEHIEIKFTAATSTKHKLEKLKGLLAHKHPNLKLGELVEMLCDLGLESWDPSKKKTAAPRKRRSNKNLVKMPNSAKAEDQYEVAPLDEPTLKGGAYTDSSQAVSFVEVSGQKKKSAALVRREVFAKAKNACENCGSTYALEVDHIQPQALGGSSEDDNLRLLCRSCNQRAAVTVFGIEKMDRYLHNPLS